MNAAYVFLQPSIFLVRNIYEYIKLIFIRITQSRPLSQKLCTIQPHISGKSAPKHGAGSCKVFVTIGGFTLRCSYKNEFQYVFSIYIVLRTYNRICMWVYTLPFLRLYTNIYVHTYVSHSKVMYSIFSKCITRKPHFVKICIR